MLISPPFLPPHELNVDDETWLRQTMTGGRPGDGFFPVSHDLCWHGGIHLTAPAAGAGAERVRAIADGTVIFKRAATGRVDDQHHALNYRGGWTDDGCVVLQHHSAIGDGVNASSIVFFSIYMHLSEVAPTVHLNGKVTRKDMLGQAGRIYGGTERKIHFEIVCDDANMQRLTGRPGGVLNLSQNGRTDSVYGEIYIHLPVGTPVFADRPMAHLAQAHRQPPRPSRNGPRPASTPLSPAALTTERLIVGLRHSGGTVDQRGDVVVTTYKLNGEIMEPCLREVNADYDLYNTAVRISEAYPAANRPAPSAVLEIFRFGRVLNVPPEVVPQMAVPNWRQITHGGVRGWVDLNARGLTKFSDADFPQWRGWTIVDDSQDGNSRCDSAILKAWLGSGATSGATASATAALNASANLPRFSKTICKFPSEWVSATVEQRWGWLKVRSSSQPAPISEDDFGELRRHINALCIDHSLVTAAQWHWQPVEFIVHLRRCGWLSEAELIRCVPSKYQREAGRRGSARSLSNITLAEARQRVINRDSAVFMRGCRKYGIDTRLRIAHFLAQIYRETNVLLWDQELASGAEYEGLEDLGNTNLGDGVRFKGRGLIQTTGRENYRKYSEYRGLTGSAAFTVEPNNLLLATDAYNCVDTAGLYWVSRHVSKNRRNISCVAELGIAEDHLRAVTQSVNGAADNIGTGLFERRSHLKVLASVLLDGVVPITPEIERRNV